MDASVFLFFVFLVCFAISLAKRAKNIDSFDELNVKKDHTFDDDWYDNPANPASPNYIPGHDPWGNPI
jgi:hypothetical protein